MPHGDPSSTARKAHAFGHAALRERPGMEAFSAALLKAQKDAAAAPTNVLLIDEDPDDILLMERALEDAMGPVQLVSVPSAAEARARIGRGDVRPDLILVGVEPRLGDVAGFLRWLGEGSGLPALPVVLLLSVDVLPQELLGGAAGPCRRLVRPVEFDALVKALNRILPPRRPA